MIKIILIVFVTIIVFAIVLACIGTIGKKEAMELEIPAIDLGDIDDGVYTGSYDNGRWSNTVQVTVQDHTIIEIEQVGENSGADSQGEFKQEIIDEVIEQQRNDIDTVSGATATTNSFLKAVANALEGER